MISSFLVISASSEFVKSCCATLSSSLALILANSTSISLESELSESAKSGCDNLLWGFPFAVVQIVVASFVVASFVVA